MAKGKNDAARADIDAVLKSTPGNVQAIYLLAVSDAQSRNYKAADADLERISGYIGRINFQWQLTDKTQLVLRAYRMLDAEGEILFWQPA